MLAVGIIGAVLARLEPNRMARALFATAIAQAFVALIALLAKLGPRGEILPRVRSGTGGFGNGSVSSKSEAHN